MIRSEQPQMEAPFQNVIPGSGETIYIYSYFSGRLGCDLQLPMQSVPITADVASSNPAQARCT